MTAIDLLETPDLLLTLRMVYTDMLRTDFPSEEARRTYVAKYVQAAIDSVEERNTSQP